MNSVKLVLVLVASLVSVSGCATHRSSHGGPSTGFVVHADTPIGGVDASIGVHNPMMGDGEHDDDERGRGGEYANGGRTGGGCDAVLTFMEDSQPLMDWASNEGQGLQLKDAHSDARVGRRVGANCSATTDAGSVLYNRQNLPPPGIRMNGDNPQSPQMQEGGRNPSSYQGGGQQYRRVSPGEYRVPEQQGPRGGGYYGR